jgi:ABC-type ATPase involved in cell division
MSLTKIILNKFTAFEDISIELSPGVNVFIGANGTGKTHLMKVAYAACDVSKSHKSFADKLTRVFLPSNRAIGRLVKRQQGKTSGYVEVYRGKRSLKASINSWEEKHESATVDGFFEWLTKPIKSVYIPVKEMLSNAPGFISLYDAREIHFEEIYADILLRASSPAPRGPTDQARSSLLRKLQQTIEGRVVLKGDEFYLSNKQGNLEFTLLAEGMRKLGLLWKLIQNGTLTDGSVLFWDEPETNLNPKMYGPLIEILLELRRSGVQIFIATHDYVILKELDLRGSKEDKIEYHSLYRENGKILWHKTNSYLDIHPNAIAEAFSNLYDREIERSIGVKASDDKVSRG